MRALPFNSSSVFSQGKRAIHLLETLPKITITSNLVLIRVVLFAKDTYLGVCRGRRVLEDWRVHENGTVITVNIIQKGRKWLVQAAVAADVTVAGRLGWHPEGHPALGCIAD